MAESITIDVYRNKNAEEFTSSLKDPQSRLNAGSAAAQTASYASSLAYRAALLVSADRDTDEIQYIIRNTEILRNYMVHLIDEDIKCKGPMRRAVKEGGQEEIEAAIHPACAICGEIINMMVQLLDFLKTLKTFACGESLVLVKQAAYFANCAMDVAREYILYAVTASTDETFRFVTKRENEITFAESEKVYLEIISD